MHYIAVTEIHDRPDLKKPLRVTKVGQPIELDDDAAADLGSAIRAMTEAEAVQFNLEDEPHGKAPKAAAKAAAKPAAKAAAKPADKSADKPADKPADAEKPADDDTAGMV